MRADRHVVMGADGTALAAPGVVALIAALPDSATARACEELLFGPDAAEGLAERLVAIGDDAPESFAIAAAGQDVTSVVVRGGAAATIDGIGDVRHDPDDGTPWATTEVDDETGITLTLTGDDAPTGQWLTTGVIGAGAVAVGRLQAPRRRARNRPVPAAGDVDFGNLVGAPTPASVADAPTAAIPRVEPPSTPDAAIPPTPDVPGPGRPDTGRSAATAPYTALAGGIGEVAISDGRVLRLDAPIVIGRRPPTDPIAGHEPQAVVVDDGLLSRHHATLRVVDGRLVVIDEGSTNGTTVTAPGRPPVRCVPGQPVEVDLGATVDVGGVLTATHQPGSTTC